jgi:hypothetical protein
MRFIGASCELKSWRDEPSAAATKDHQNEQAALSASHTCACQQLHDAFSDDSAYVPTMAKVMRERRQRPSPCTEWHILQTR